MNYSGAQAMHLRLSAGRFQLLETVYSVSEGLEMETDVRAHVEPFCRPAGCAIL